MLTNIINEEGVKKAVREQTLPSPKSLWHVGHLIVLAQKMTPGRNFDLSLTALRIWEELVQEGSCHQR